MRISKIYGAAALLAGVLVLAPPAADACSTFVVERGRIMLKTVGNAEIRTIEMKKFDFDCAVPPRQADSNTPASQGGR